MPYKQTPTQRVVRLVALRALAPATLAQCQALRAEAGRLWTDLVRLHTQARVEGRWLGAGELEQATKGGQYALLSRRVQALCQTLAAHVATAVALRRQEMSDQGHVQTASPQHPKTYQTVVWKDQALTVLSSGEVRLPTGGQRPPLLLPLPEDHRLAHLRRAEWTWRADHDERCLTLDTGETLPSPLPTGAVAGVGLGEVHVAAVTTTNWQALVVSGRQLRACKQWRNKVHSVLQEKLSRCHPGSRRARRLLQRNAQVSAKLYRQQRDLLHQAARTVVDFCQAEGVTRIAVGDVRDIQTGVSLGKQTNQKISQWPHGQFARYLTEKAACVGITVEWIDEAYSTRTCCVSGHVQPSSPRGRRFRCLGCGARVRRDVNGSANICSKAMYGRYSQVQADTVKYLRPIGVAPRTQA
jgi:putative transposase